MVRSTTMRAIVVLLVAPLLTSCLDDRIPAAERTGVLAQIKDRGVINVVTRNAATSYYIDREDQPQGPEQAMVQSFADDLGVKVHYIVKDSIAGVLDSLASGEADIAAAGLTRTPARSKHFAFGPDYQKITEQVVCNGGLAQPDNIDELAGMKLVVIPDSSYLERLRTLKKTNPDLSWTVSGDVGTETLLRRAWKGRIDCTVADSNIVAINRRYYPSLKIAFDLDHPEHLAWAMPPKATALVGAVRSWFKQYKADGDLAAMKDRYYGYLPKFDFVDNRTLVRRIDTRFDKFDNLFVEAGKKHDIPPLLLAAQAYQESHWDPKAISPTGVRGIMMLTQRTAHALGVKNRLDPAESINGGAQYLARMRERTSDKAKPRDRTFLALAAYNIGFAHLRDAQTLARRLGKDPHSWADMRTVLPLLAEKRYYKTLKYGYARGTEPVRYVNRIRNYEDVIREHVHLQNVSLH